MLNSTEHENSTVLKIKTKMLQKIIFFFYFRRYVVFIMLINVKMPTYVGILTFMSMINLILGRVEHEKSFITSVHSFMNIEKMKLTF